ncbi:alcohol dehydrogenase catalytic domain-containing protein [Spirosoma sp. HMF4905]|uniref:Alcohol dehydrogenase catalytic domain-containing protein n=1 Tax=Spirosoma arboris TaxID=2682092 RepID=A0A7K1SN67_9BACT|nr:NAD(P)-dependent alcohol dehydrogenase [Spirosoma arboris]MVM35046.1 alcohol dehydrogenase catalytic domain-containing protein [Spirosoma arboris]
MNKPENHTPRRQFIQQSAALSATVMLVGPTQLLTENKAMKNTASKGYAAKSKSDKLDIWSFERRAVGDNDILIDVKFSGICHSDIHQIRGHWGAQTYPQIPGHEIAGVVSAVGKNVTKFKVGDQAGVGCMVDSCMTCTSCTNGEEHHCDNHATVFTYGSPDKTSPTGITQGGYANNLVVKEHFAIRIPNTIRLQDAAPLLCAGITTYSPLMRSGFAKGDKVGVAGIGGLGHLAIKLAVAKGAEVYAFTTSESKRKDILGFGAKEVIVVDSLDKLKPYAGRLDYMISTIPYAYEVSNYLACVRPYGSFTQVGQPVGGQLTINNSIFMYSRVNYNSSLIGGIPETQEVMDHCAENKIYPQIEVISAKDINATWDKVVNKEARYRYVIDMATIS